MRRAFSVAAFAQLWLLCLAFHPGSSLAAERRVDEDETEPSDALVRVNDDAITRQELERYVNLFYIGDQKRAQYQALAPAERDTLLAGIRKEALEILIDRRLFVQEARRVLLSREGAEKAFDEFAKEDVQRLIEKMGSPIAYREFLSANNISTDEFLQVRKEAILINELLRIKVDSRVRVPPARIRKYYREHKEEFRQPGKIICRQLWVDPSDCETRQQELEKARGILERIQRGADFGQMADRYSLDREDNPGGLHVLKGPQAGGTWLRDVLASLRPGQVSGVHYVKGAGYCIVKLERVVEPRVLAFSDVSEEIRRKLHDEEKARARKALARKLRAGARLWYYPAGEKIRGQGHPSPRFRH